MSTNFVEDTAPGPNSGLIEVLSYRTYPSLVSALREVVSNASDADASKLNISVSRTHDAQLNKVVWKLTFFDDGEGMTLDEFKNYLRLSGLGRRDRTSSDATPSGRPIIGMLGIGSLAIAPWADRVEILTKKRDNSQVLHVQVPYAKFFNNPGIRGTDLYGAAGEYKYKHMTFELQNSEASDVNNGFTIIDLIGLTDEAINELVDPNWDGNWDTADLGLLGEKYQDYLASTKSRGRLSFRKFPPLLRFMHRLAMLIPVPYPASTPVQSPPIRTMVNMLSAQCMDAVTVQGVKLQRPMLILDQQTEADKSRRPGCPARAPAPVTSNPPQGIVNAINEMLPNSNVQIRGYIWGQNTQIKFQDLAGIQVRIKNVGIGSYNFALFDPAQELDNRSSTRASRAQAISGEIFIDYSKELERALRGDREGFQESSPVYIELKTAIYKHVQKMYQRIDALAPSRQEPAKKAAPSKTANDDSISLVEVGSTQGMEVIADVVPPAVAESGNKQTQSKSDTVPAPKMEDNVDVQARDLTDLYNEAQSNGTRVESTEPVLVAKSPVSALRSYKMHKNARRFPSIAVEVLTDAQILGDEIIVNVKNDVLLSGLPKHNVDQVCVVAAALAMARIARENQISLTELDAASALEMIEKEANNA